MTSIKPIPLESCSTHDAWNSAARLRLAAIIGPGIFMLGAAAGHVYQMITAHNFAPGNAGIIFWSDILLPLLGFALLWLQRWASPSHR